jgi:plasmid stabilization system protein ParE
VTHVIVGPVAEEDLESIGDYLALNAPQTALSFLKDMRRAISRLASFPEAHPPVPGYEGKGVRYTVNGKYLIFYKVNHDVHVLRVLHSARDYGPLLGM